MNRRSPSMAALAVERRVARIPQKEIAKLIGRSVSWVSNAESGSIAVAEPDRKAYEQALLVLRLQRARPALDG